MSLKNKLEDFGGKIRNLDGNALGNLAFATSIGIYQVYEQFAMNQNPMSLIALGISAVAGIFTVKNNYSPKVK
ncbi:Uncharacterised protein [uncultured archaeon]|nr:Uncharacterised protein [uncultured archaeon]